MSTNKTVSLISIDQYFPASALKKALKFPVRELEETTKGTWVAFVDEGADSYDVQIVLKDGNIDQHHCDCEQKEANGYCMHQLAVMQQLATLKLPNAKPATKRKVKEDPLDTLINQVEINDLRLWVKDLLKKHKDLHVAFTHQFTSTPTEFKSAEIVAITENGMKAVIKNKKKIDQTELKKILTLWQSLHEPIIAYYISNIADPGKADLLGALIVAITDCESYLQINTNKIETYKRGLLQKTIQSIYELENEEIWQQVIIKLSQQNKKLINNLSLVWVHFLNELANLETRKHRTEFIIKILLKQYTDFIEKHQYTSHEPITKLIWKTCSDKEMTNLCIKVIQPIYEKEFNTNFIHSLLSHHEWALAETHLHTIMSRVLYEEEKLPYLEILKSIYARQPNRSKEMILVLKNLIPFNYSYEDYLYLIELVNKADDKGDFIQWKNKVIKHLAYHKSTNVQASFLYFDILLVEKPNARLVSEIGKVASAQVAVRYFDQLFTIHKLGLLKELSIFSPHYKYWESDEKFYGELWNKIAKSYTRDELYNIFMAKESKKYHGNFYNWLQARNLLKE